MEKGFDCVKGFKILMERPSLTLQFLHLRLIKKFEVLMKKLYKSKFLK